MLFMNFIRNCKKKNFKFVVKEFMKVIIEIVMDIFKRLRRIYGQVFVYDVSDEEEIFQLFEMIKIFDGDLDFDKIREIKDF